MMTIIVGSVAAANVVLTTDEPGRGASASIRILQDALGEPAKFGARDLRTLAALLERAAQEVDIANGRKP